MHRSDAVEELKNRLEYEVSEGGPHSDIPALITVEVPGRERPIAVSDGAMEAAEQRASRNDEDPMDALEDFVRQSVENYADRE